MNGWWYCYYYYDPLLAIIWVSNIIDMHTDLVHHAYGQFYCWFSRIWFQFYFPWDILLSDRSKSCLFYISMMFWVWKCLYFSHYILYVSSPPVQFSSNKQNCAPAWFWFGFWFKCLRSYQYQFNRLFQFAKEQLWSLTIKFAYQ
jgi:hypothetical protein